MRLAARPPALLGQDGLLEATFCGAEANVAVALAGLGHGCDLFTALPEGRLGDAAVHAVRAFGVNTAGVLRSDQRMGLYFLSPGAMARPAEIIYDRAQSAFTRITAETFDWPALLQGVDWLFVTGITAALGDGPLAALRQAMAAARAGGTRVAFDCNYRATLWSGREAEARAILLELSLQADLLLAGRRAIGLLLDRRFDQADSATGFRAAADAMFALAPELRHVAATRREIGSADRQQLTALLASRGSLAVSPTIALDAIVDRIGTGDAFAAGLIHGLASGLDETETVGFAAACAQWAHGVSGDFLRASLADIEHLRAGGGGDVRR